MAAELLPAQGYDPRYRWRTLDAPHFRIHHHQGLEELAQRTAAACERARAALSPLIGHLPADPVDVVLSDDADDANGSATAFPRNAMRLYAVPPGSLSELDDYGDWLDSLVTHEYTHILHLDGIHGLAAAVDAVFGRVLVPSGLGPPWITEGLAVLHESRPGAGRNDSALFDGWARMLVLERGLPDLATLSSQPLEWPRGGLWYLLGGRFLAQLAERHGQEALRAFLADQGSQVWPYLLNTLAERHFGRSFDDLWLEFGRSLRDRYRAQAAAVAARTPPAPRPLTRRGALVYQPRFDRESGTLLHAEQGYHERPGLRRVSLAGADLGRVAVAEGNGAFALLPGGRAVVAITDLLEEYRSVDDLYLVDLADGRRTRLTHGERATDPDADRAGAAVTYVGRLPGGEHALRRMRLDGAPGSAVTLLRRPGAQLFLPRISPDGRRVALEIQERGRRDVAVWDGDGLRFVTDDDALDQAPSWSPDGRTLYFSSDRSGIFNVYAFELDGDELPAPPGGRARLGGRLRQVTDVLGGALQPEISPDGTTLAFVAIGGGGLDVAVLPVADLSSREPPPAPSRPAHQLAPEPPVEPIPSRPYRPSETLGPTWWLPFATGDGAGTALGATTGGADVVGRHAWALSAWTGLRSRETGYDLAYASGVMQPILTLASARSVGSALDGRLEEDFVPADLALTWTRSHLDRAQAIALGWRLHALHAIGRADPLVRPFRGGTSSELSLDLAYGSAARFGHSISAEEGAVAGLFLRWASPDLGGDQRFLTARASGSGYLRLPGTRHAVLALHGSLGASSGSLAGSLPFSLGGIPPPDLAALVADALGGSFPALKDELRGYPSGAFAGATLVSTTVELRFPLLAPGLGHSTWPLFLRRLHGALFLDGGAAFATRPRPSGRRLGDLELLRFGAGAELRLEVVLGYYLRTDVRLGLARGLGPLLASPRPPDPLRATQAYLTVGESF